MIELRHLRTLLALRETGSLVEAAERVHLTQSALSHQLKDLESRVDSALFVRKTRPVEFTRAGLRLLALADEILPEVRKAERDLARLAGTEQGGSTWPSSAIAAFSGSCPRWITSATTGRKWRSIFPAGTISTRCLPWPVSSWI
ncbi:hypothetical protein HAALTHF_19150n [Vreelandella aquamarina]|nr:hypothetical protein HAALTHF_19150n [Halomonas axialensis]